MERFLVTVDDILFASNLQSAGLRIDEIASIMWKRRERLFVDVPVLSRTLAIPNKGYVMLINCRS